MSYYAKGSSRGKRAYNVYMSTSATAQKALELATKVASLVNVEFKFHDTTMGTGISSTPTITLLTDIDQGDSNLNREGNQVKCKSLNNVMYATQHASATLTLLRRILFIDTQQDGTTPASQELLQDNTNILSLKRHDYRKRFIILDDQLITLGDQKMFHTKYYKKMSMALNWTSATGTDTINNHIYQLLMSSEPTNTPSVYTYSRVLFLDN